MNNQVDSFQMTSRNGINAPWTPHQVLVSCEFTENQILHLLERLSLSSTPFLISATSLLRETHAIDGTLQNILDKQWKPPTPLPGFMSQIPADDPLIIPHKEDMMCTCVPRHVISRDMEFLVKLRVRRVKAYITACYDFKSGKYTSDDVFEGDPEEDQQNEMDMLEYYKTNFGDCWRSAYNLPDRDVDIGPFDFVVSLKVEDTVVGCCNLKEKWVYEEQVNDDGKPKPKRLKYIQWFINKAAVPTCIQGQGYGTLLLESAEYFIGKATVSLFKPMANFKSVPIRVWLRAEEKNANFYIKKGYSEIESDMCDRRCFEKYLGIFTRQHDGEPYVDTMHRGEKRRAGNNAADNFKRWKMIKTETNGANPMLTP